MAETPRPHLVAILLAIALIVPLLLAAPEASAQPDNPVCEAGALQDDVCVVDYGPVTCPEDFALVDGACLTIQAAVTDAECPTGALGEPGACYIFVPRGPGPVCEQGELIGSVCVETQPVEPSCPEGFEPDDSLNGICARFEEATQLPPSCPQGALGEPGSCYILVAPGPAELSCPEGELDSGVCVIIGDPPVATGGECPVSATVFLEDGFCFTIEAAQPDGSCPADTIPDPNSGECRRPVAIVPGPKVCGDGFSLINGQCIRFEAPVISASCPPGSFATGEGECRQPVADAAGSFECPDDAALNGETCVFTAGFILECPNGFALIDGDCVRITPPMSAACPNGSFLDSDGQCRKPVADVVGDPYCVAADAVLVDGLCELTVEAECATGQAVDGRCIDELPPTYYCDGRVVTINMMLGDRGRGTRGDDVILGTDGRDVIVGRGGNDVICAGGGRDLVFAGAGADVVYGGPGADRLFGGSADDFLYGGNGADVLVGGNGHDSLLGENGRDSLWGNRGDDRLDGGAGNDRCRGGQGNNNIQRC